MLCNVHDFRLYKYCQFIVCIKFVVDVISYPMRTNYLFSFFINTNCFVILSLIFFLCIIIILTKYFIHDTLTFALYNLIIYIKCISVCLFFVFFFIKEMFAISLICSYRIKFIKFTCALWSNSKQLDIKWTYKAQYWDLITTMVQHSLNLIGEFSLSSRCLLKM